MRNALIMAAKDLHLLWRDKFALFWVAAFPLLMALFIGAMFGGSGPTAGIGLAVVDLDGTEASRAFVAALEQSDGIRLDLPEDGSAHTLGSARQAVRAGSVTAFLAIPQGYGEAGTLAFGRPGPTLEVGIDPARRAEAGFLHGLIVKASFERLREGFAEPKAMGDEARRTIESLESTPGDEPALPAEQHQALLSLLRSVESYSDSLDQTTTPAAGAPVFEPVRVEVTPVTREGRRPPNAFAISFPQAMSWGVIGCCASFAIGLVQERTRGTYARLRMAPNPPWAILAGKATACFTACVGSTLLMILFGLIFGVTVGSWLALAAAVTAVAFGFTGLMMLISTLGRTEQSVASAGWAAMMPLAMLGGGMVPLMIMPEWMLRLSNVSPVKWMIVAVEGAMWRGFSATEMLLPCAILLGVGVAGLAAGAVVITRRSW